MTFIDSFLLFFDKVARPFKITWVPYSIFLLHSASLKQEGTYQRRQGKERNTSLDKILNVINPYKDY